MKWKRVQMESLKSSNSEIARDDCGGMADVVPERGMRRGWKKAGM